MSEPNPYRPTDCTIDDQREPQRPGSFGLLMVICVFTLVGGVASIFVGRPFVTLLGVAAFAVGIAFASFLRGR